MLYTKPQAHGTFGSGEEDFWRVFTIYGRGSHLGHVTQTPRTNFCSPIPLRCHMKSGFDRPSSFGDEDLWKWWTDGQRTPDHGYTISSPMSLKAQVSLVGWLCWGLTSQSTIFQSCRDGAIASWVINQYFRGVNCLAQGHNTAAVGLEPRTSRSRVRHSTTEPPRSPLRWAKKYATKQWIEK